jgi:tripartite motif-containing protein 2/3
MEETLPQLDIVASNVNSKAKHVLCEIDVIIDYQITTLLKRKKELRSQVQDIRKSRIQALKEQQENVKSSLTKLQHACKFTEITMTTSGNHNDATALVLKSLLTSRLQHFTDRQSKYLEPVEDSFLELQCDDSLLHRAIETFGRLDTSFACPKQCIARGVGIKAALATEPTKFTVFLMNRHGERLARSGGAVTVDIVTQDGRKVNVDSIVSKRDGTHEVTYNPMQRGSLTITVRVQGEQIRGSPFHVPVSSDLKKSWI